MSMLKVILILSFNATYLISLHHCFESNQAQQVYDTRRRSRQLYEMADLVNDVAMITLLGIPFLGLFALGANIFGPMINESLSNSRLAKDSIPSWSSYYQLYQKMVHLESLLKKLRIFESECQLRAICEINRSKSENNLARNLINELKSLKFDLESNELFPISRIVTSKYRKALEGSKQDCSAVFKQCSKVFESKSL